MEIQFFKKRGRKIMVKYYVKIIFWIRIPEKWFYHSWLHYYFFTKATYISRKKVEKDKFKEDLAKHIPNIL